MKRQNLGPTVIGCPMLNLLPQAELRITVWRLLGPLHEVSLQGDCGPVGPNRDVKNYK